MVITHIGMLGSVHGGVKLPLGLAEDSEDLEAFEERAREPSLSFAEVLKEMRQSGEL